MSDLNQIFDEIRKSEMNDWVGGSDPEAVGDGCVGILRRYLTINASSRLLDFGCGIGRVLLSVLKHNPAVGHVTGFDIMPQVISFCEKHIADNFPQTSFELMQGSNDHYDLFIAAASESKPKSHSTLLGQYGSSFTGAYAFSVFTHLERADFQALLKLLADLLEPGGELLFTAFLLTPYSRRAIEERTALFPFGETALEDNGSIFIGNPSDRLAFIAFDLPLVEQMVFDAGLILSHVEHGSWTGSGFAATLQDVIVCRRPRVLQGAIQHVAIVPRPLRT
ncbi:MAG: class I SAM-dependent methyltransferase [Rubrivivax sp.]|nr:class I SAM-dependent methyltransferase [Rubrivivax sp.]MDP3225165.1 class I SAM-dependent methyltransferase [Rubrivivax sp.]MDP3610369.1 class I SAM-dependent methyltransferase [Rubrivivax sp.]